MSRAAWIVLFALSTLHQATSGAAPSPGVRTSHVLLYHEGLHRVVMITGSRVDTTETIWAWDGTAWAPAAIDGPPARGLGAAAFDSARGVLVLHGGAPGRVSLGDTWEWDGTRWSQRDESHLRDHHAMTFDRARQRTVLFGGLRRPTEARDSWEWIGDVSEWDGRSWKTIEAPGPGGRVSPNLAYDAARRQVLLFGGGDQAGVSLGDTWSWDGARWQKMSDTGPAPRRAHAMAFDPARGAVLLYGGTNGTTHFDDLWQWGGTQWTALPSTSPSPGARFGAAMAFDEARGVLVLHGGFQDGRILGDTWEWSGGAWTMRATSSDPGSSVPRSREFPAAGPRESAYR